MGIAWMVRSANAGVISDAMAYTARSLESQRKCLEGSSDTSILRRLDAVRTAEVNSHPGGYSTAMSSGAAIMLQSILLVPLPEE